MVYEATFIKRNDPVLNRQLVKPRKGFTLAVFTWPWIYKQNLLIMNFRITYRKFCVQFIVLIYLRPFCYLFTGVLIFLSFLKASYCYGSEDGRVDVIIIVLQLSVLVEYSSSYNISWNSLVMYRVLKLPLFVFVIYSPDDGTWFPKHVGIKVCFCCLPSGILKNLLKIVGNGIWVKM